MLENEFDRQVKKMMDELKLRPSESVWPGVEKRIREKKRWRRAFIILPLLVGMMLLGYSGIQYFQSNKDRKEFEIHSPDESNKQSEKNKPSIPLKSDNAVNKNPGNKDIPAKQETKVVKATIPSKIKIRKGSSFDNDPDNKQLLSSSTKTPENFITPEQKNEKKNQAIPGYDDSNLKNENPSANVSNQKNEDKIVANIDTTYIKGGGDSSLVKEVPFLKSVDSNLIKKVIYIKPAADSAVSKKQQDEKLRLGFHFSTGVSGTRSKFFQLNQNKSLDFPANPNSGTGSTYSQPVPGTARTGIAFKAGVLVEKNISKRSSLDLGLQYSYYSDHLKVGSRSDSVIRIESYYSANLFVSGFYPITPTNNYINRYHFIELPLNHHYQLINGKQNSFSWDFGISIGQLLSTNTLVFDTTNRGVYYTDKKLFRKTHVNLSTGFSITFNKHKPTQWVVGPQLQLGLINFYKRYTDKKAYPFFAGIDLRLMLPKK